MSTGSLTRVFITATGKDFAPYSYQVLMCMYKHSWGSPAQYGRELASFVTNGKLRDGISGGEVLGQCFNGGECFAASILSHFKTTPGGVYLFPADSSLQSCGTATFSYDFYIDNKSKIIAVYASTVDKVLFQGTPQKFVKFCAKYK